MNWSVSNQRSAGPRELLAEVDQFKRPLEELIQRHDEINTPTGADLRPNRIQLPAPNQLFLPVSRRI